MDGFRFSPAHLTILAAVPGVAGLLSGLGRGSRKRSSDIARFLGGALGVNEIVWYAYRLRTEGWRFPEGMPLHLCDLAVWMTVAACWKRSNAVFELAYYVGLGGSAMALLMPDLWAPLRSYPTAYYFLAHGGVAVALLTLLWTGQVRPRPGSEWRALVVWNTYALLVGLFNAVFDTNYIYLCRKPLSPSLLDYLGPWPFYILAGEAIAVLMFYLLSWPFRASAPPRRGAACVLK